MGPARWAESRSGWRFSRSGLSLTTREETDMHPLDAFLATLAAVFVPLGLIGAYLTHRQRLQDEAEEAERAAGTAAE